MDRMQHHFGSSKVKPAMQVGTSMFQKPLPKMSLIQTFYRNTETESLRKQVAELQIQLTEQRGHSRKKQEQRQLQLLNLQLQQLGFKYISKPQGQNQNLGFAPNKGLVDKKCKELQARTAKL